MTAPSLHDPVFAAFESAWKRAEEHLAGLPETEREAARETFRRIEGLYRTKLDAASDKLLDELTQG